MTLNPRLKVLAVSGYHDLATPFHQTERDLERLGANPNLLIRNYNGGHMTYLDDQSRALQKADLAQFYQLATQP
jgi:carboxypeptidase C (cathepsin A)